MKYIIIKNNVPYIEANESLVLYRGTGNPIILTIDTSDELKYISLSWNEYKESNTYILFYIHMIEMFQFNISFDEYVDLLSNSKILKLINKGDTISEPYIKIMENIGVQYEYLYDFVTNYRTIYVSKRHKSARK